MSEDELIGRGINWNTDTERREVGAVRMEDGRLLLVFRRKLLDTGVEREHVVELSKEAGDHLTTILLELPTSPYFNPA
jgi:hypothetical protein